MIDRMFMRDDNKTWYKRVNKTQARKTYNSGNLVVMCPSNLKPFGPWYPEIGIIKPHNRTEINQESRFDKLVNYFEIQYCTSKQTGKYAAFYVEMKK